MCSTDGQTDVFSTQIILHLVLIIGVMKNQTDIKYIEERNNPNMQFTFKCTEQTDRHVYLARIFF